MNGRKITMEMVLTVPNPATGDIEDVDCTVEGWVTRHTSPPEFSVEGYDVWAPDAAGYATNVVTHLTAGQRAFVEDRLCEEWWGAP